MGIVYHSHYLDYFEAARTEALREMGLTYRTLEDSGVIMPVTELSIRYRRPAYYDDVLQITTSLDARPPRTRVRFDYEIHRDGEPELIADGRVTLCFVDRSRNRPIAAPEEVIRVFNSTRQADGRPPEQTR